MASFKKNIKVFFQNDWIIGVILLLAFLATNGYTYAWDDQHLEIPLLKSLIDHNLYQGDYYVESLKKNFPSYFYPLLAKVITVDQVPITYFLLYLISRYFLFLFSYKLWFSISQRKFAAFCCVLTMILLCRVDEFLYRTFSHQEFALGIILGGIYFFYRERFLLASALLGISANVHALYSLFPMIYLLIYLLENIRRYGWKMIIKASTAFFIFALPVFLWTFQKYIRNLALPNDPIFQDWISLYQIACPANFIFQDIPLKSVFSNWMIFLKATERYLMLLVLYIFNLTHNKTFREDKKMKATVLACLLSLIVSFIFTYIYPSRFIIDLNLVRNTQFLLYFLVGYTTLTVLQVIRDDRIWVGAITVISFALLEFYKYGEMSTTFAVTFLIFFLLLKKFWRGESVLKHNLVLTALIIGLILCALGLFLNLRQVHWNIFSKITLIVIPPGAIIICLLYYSRWGQQRVTILRNMLILIPLIVSLLNYSYYHYCKLEIQNKGPGFWQMQRNWEDMQRFVKTHTPQNASLLVPHDMEMGGFRILSERKIICCYRDCGIIGFDYRSAVEWQKRLKDIEPFKVYIDHPTTTAILNALFKYKVNYIVFMNYANPGNNDLLEKIYTNQVFCLYKVKSNPVPSN